MKNILKNLFSMVVILVMINGCKKTDYSIGDLKEPSNIVVNTEVVGQDASHPNGDGSGKVKVTISADNALGYKIDYDISNDLDLKYLPSGSTTITYGTEGLHTYTITAVVYGKGGTSSSTTKDVTVRSDFTADPVIVTNLTNDASKTWVVDKSVPGHFGVGPWEVGSIRPQWWSASINEKVACCNCFYTATFTFTKVASSNAYTLQVASPDGAFTKTGALTTLPGIPGAGGEACYGYAGGTSNFSFVRATSGAPVVPTDPGNYSTTETSIMLAGVNTYIGYGSLLKEYEILEITPTYLLLRAQGTETGNAWYLKLKSL
ncbi:MAG TPA: hypothetical protein PLC48_03960 [Ferruginibacter sp.]|nr:hypothetical protein [Ferruginibacter sp.]